MSKASDDVPASAKWWPDTAGTCTPADIQDAFDAWLDDSDHSILVMSIDDECWRSLAYNAALAAYKAGRQVAITKTWNAAQATQRELMRREITSTWKHYEYISKDALLGLLDGDDSPVTHEEVLAACPDVERWLEDDAP